MVELKPVSESDRQRLYDWRIDPTVDRWMSDAVAPDWGLHNFWFDSLLNDPDVQGWVIYFAHEPVGFLSLTGLLSPNRRAEWGWYVASPVARGRGVGRAAQVLGLDIAFGTYGLERVWAQVLADNDAALRAQGAAGFRREGYLRNHLFKAETFHDVVILGVLSNEWKENRERLISNLVRTGLLEP
jgi:UDP-4-amino-4,6-dideoxy-N-acetyl-beta-L-altrosamine N-acetyltransferase